MQLPPLLLRLPTRLPLLPAARLPPPLPPALHPAPPRPLPRPLPARPFPTTLHHQVSPSLRRRAFEADHARGTHHPASPGTRTSTREDRAYRGRVLNDDGR